MSWLPYPKTERSTVVGDLRVLPDFYSPQLENRRDLLVYLPPSYRASSQHYPVLYMHDGHNLFDEARAFSGEWRVDETLEGLAGEGLEAIVVGLPNAGEARRSEYSPYPNPSEHLPIPQARGERYLDFVTHTVKPLVDESFRTLPGSDTTLVAGSSMGGLISLYAFLTRPEVFGVCGSFSPAYGIGTRGLLATVRQRATGRGRVYLDVGGKEGAVLGALEPGWEDKYSSPDDAYAGGVRELREALLERGYREGSSLMYVEEADGHHNERAWARRLPAALRFLLGR